MNYINVPLRPIKFRTLAVLSDELTKNHKHENNELREYGNTNEKKCKKSKYPEDANTKQNITHVTEKGNTNTSYLKKYKNEIEAISNKSPPSLINTEVQKKLYNDFDVKEEMYFQKVIRSIR